jgi:hypothetical protein
MKDLKDSERQEAFHMVPADIQAVDIQVADIQAVVHNPVVGCYKDPLVEVVMGERSHHTDLADSGLDPDLDSNSCKYSSFLHT